MEEPQSVIDAVSPLRSASELNLEASITAADLPGSEKMVTSVSGRAPPYAWCVVFAVFMIHVIVDGMTNSFGSLYDELKVKFQGSAVSISMVASVLLGVTYGCGPLADFLCDKFGARVVAAVGASLACAGFSLSLLTEAIWQLTLTYGALTGLGFGFMYFPAMVTVASWFDKRRSLAIAIAVSGSGVGTFAFNPLTTSLVEKVGLSNCLLIMSGIAASGIVFAILLRPAPRPNRQQIRKDVDVPTTEAGKSSSVSVRICRWVKRTLDWPLLSSWSFLLYCASAFLGGFAAYAPYIYLVDRAKEEAAATKEDAAWLTSTIGIANILGRLTSGALSDRKIVNNTVLYSAACLLAGFVTSISVLCETYVEFAVYAATFGYASGAIVTLQTVVLTDMVGVEKLSNAFGILLFVQGTAVFVGPPFSGYLIEITDGSYHLCFIVFGVIMFLSGLLIFLVPVINYFRMRSQSKELQYTEKFRQTGSFCVHLAV